MYLFSRQFLLIETSAAHRFQKSWSSIKLGQYTLFHAPDLGMHTLAKNGVCYVLLGFAFHSCDAMLSEPEMLERLTNPENDLLEETDQWCGSWLLIRKQDKRVTLYPDAGATRKAFVCLQEGTCFAVATDPALIKSVVEVVPNHNHKATDFYQSPFFSKQLIRLGFLTQYRQVKQLLPNHRLILPNGTLERIFPRTARAEIGPEQCIDRLAFYWENILTAANRRFQLNCAFTAGLDSRTLVAATEALADDVHYYTFYRLSRKKQRPDFQIPPRIARDFHLDYQQYRIEEAVEVPEKDLFSRSYDLVPTRRLPTFFNGYFRNFDREKDLQLIGTISEVCKRYYGEALVNDGRSLTKAAGFPAFAYVEDHFEEKYQELSRLEQSYGYDLRDLAHWEQNVTNFAAQNMQYTTFVGNVFSPFNCRQLMQTLLHAPPKFRDKQNHQLYRLFIDRMAPGLNRYPYNPTLKIQLIRLGKRLGIYQFYKRYATKWQL